MRELRIKNGPMRFLSVELRCTNCGSFWEAPSVLARRDGEWEYQHVTSENCLLCGSPGEPTDDGVGALADGMDAEEPPHA